MDQMLEVRKTVDGKVFARRKDGFPLTAEDREEVLKLAEVSLLPVGTAARPCQRSMTSTEIASLFVGAVRSRPK